MISTELNWQKINVKEATDDSDTVIVKTAIDMAKTVQKPIIVVAQDTDILVLLLYHQPTECTNLYLQSDTDGLWDISSINIKNREDLLFNYGWSGNDTVSSIYGHSKTAIFKCKFPNNAVNTFYCCSSTHSEIRWAGIRAMQVVYGLGGKTLEIAPLKKFQEHAAKGRIDPDKLPPTEDATFQHSLRVHLQIAIWKSLKTSILQPVGRGWELQSDNILKPKMFSGEIAPPNLLKRICCNCQEGDKQCQTLKRSCLRSGMTCVGACGHCSGHCSNGEKYDANELTS